MKQTVTLLLTAIFCLVLSAHAQINKGSILLGGTINGSSQNLKDRDSSVTKQSNFAVSPALGFAISTNTILGFSLTYSTSNNRYYEDFFERKGNTYGAGVFLRKYKLLAKGFYLFGEGNLAYTYGSYNYSLNNSSSDYKSKANVVSLNVTPGIAYNLTRSIQLESGLQSLLYINYGIDKETPKNPANETSYKVNSFSVGTSLNPVSLSGIFVGARFLFNK